MHPALQAVMGVLVFAGLAFACSRNRQSVRWRFVGLAVTTQFAVAALFLHVGVAKALLSGLTQVAKLLEDSTRQATSFVFGYVGGAEAPFEIGAGASTFVFAFQVLPIIIVVGALSALLWHWRVLNAVIAPVAWIVRRTLGVSGPIGFVAVANAFLSMLEGPMLIKPYLSRLKEHELFAVMTVGLSTVAGGYSHRDIEHSLGRRTGVRSRRHCDPNERVRRDSRSRVSCFPETPPTLPTTWW